MSERFELAPGYSISRLIHGGWQFSSGHRLSGPALDDALEVLVESADAGVTTFDCADIYTGVEELYGRFLRRWASTSAATPLQIHTKFVPDYADLPWVDRAYVERIIDRSLTRLGVERLDLVQYYWWRDDVPGLEQTAIWLGELQEAGKIRHIGATNLDAARMQRIVDAGVTLVSNQVQYSALDRRPEHGLRQWSEEAGTHLICFGALAGGFLTDRWLGREAPDGHENRSLTKYRLIIDEFGGWDAYQALVAELVAVGQEHGVAASAAAIRFVLDQPRVAGVISGATRLGQMPRNVDALSLSLTDEGHARIRRLVDMAPGPLGDIFELERDREGPHGRIMKYDLNKSALNRPGA
jgi:aryl-alcohol dehydrogenase-like predicted oxidoreductase